MAKVLQRLDILLFANTAQYRSEMRETQESTTTMFGAIKADAANMAKVGAAAFAGMAVAGTAAIGVMIKEQADLGLEITALAKVANTGVESIQKLAIAAKHVGVEQATLGDIYKDTQDKVGDFLSTGGGAMADYFENVAPLIGQTAEQFRELSGPDALQLYYNGLQEANLSQSELVFYMEGIASDASLLIPLLHDAGAGFDVWAEAAENAGAIMSEETVTATMDLQAANDLMMLSYDGAKTQFTSAFIPVLADVANQLVGSSDAADIARQSGEFLVKTFKVMAATGLGVVTVVKAIGTAIGGMGAILAQWGNITDGVDFSSPFAFFQLAKNAIYDIPKSQIALLRDVVGDIASDFTTANNQMTAIYALGNGSADNQYITAAQGQREVTRQYGLTGQQIQANADAADVAAKASAKAAAATLKATEKQTAAQARLVGIAGNSGIGTGSHIDIRYASSDARRHTKPSQDHVNRFEVNGKALGSLTKTSDFNLNRVHPVRGKVEPHYGIDYDTEIGDNITTKVAVKDVKAWYDSKGGGYVTTVTFADGVKMNLLHQTAASKNIKGGATVGTKNSYSQATSDADQLFKQQAAAEERHQLDLARIAEQQANQRTAIRYEYANEVTRIETNLKDKLAKIAASGFDADEAQAFSDDAKERARIELANYEDTQAKKLASFSDFTRSERDLVTQNAIYQATAVLRDNELNKDQRDQALEFIKQKAVYELNQLDLVHDQQMQYATQAEQTDIERITNQYALERREIQLTINMDEQLRKAKIEALNQAEELALRERRYAFESELSQLKGIGQSELAALRADYANQRRFLDTRTDINDGQKSDLRNAMAGGQIYDTNQLQKGSRDSFGSFQAEMNGTSQNYALSQQYKVRLDLIQKALDDEVIAVEQAEQAKYDSRLAFETAATQLTIASAATIAGNMSASFKTLLGEQNAFYQISFLSQQSFAMASAGINMYKAWGDAMAEGTTMTQKFASAAVIVTEFGNIINAASAMTLELPGYQVGGFTATGGDSDPVGLVHANEFVANAPTTRKYRPELEAMHNGTYDRNASSAPNVNVSVTVTMEGKSSVESDSAIGKQIGQGLAAVVSTEVMKMMRPNALLDKAYAKR